MDVIDLQCNSELKHIFQPSKPKIYIIMTLITKKKNVVSEISTKSCECIWIIININMRPQIVFLENENYQTKLHETFKTWTVAVLFFF